MPAPNGETLSLEGMAQKASVTGQGWAGEGRQALWEGLSGDLVFYPKGTEEPWRILFFKRIGDPEQNCICFIGSGLEIQFGTESGISEMRFGEGAFQSEK